MSPLTKTFTSRQLRRFRGVRGGPIFVAVKGVVYDVTEASQFYGPGAPYHIFAGRECARALALLKVSENELNDNVENLDDTERKCLEEWVGKFKLQYKVVGKIDNKKRSLVRRCLPIVAVAVAIAGIILHKS